MESSPKTASKIGAQARLGCLFLLVRCTTKPAVVVASWTVAGPSKEAVFFTHGQGGTDCKEEEEEANGGLLRYKIAYVKCILRIGHIRLSKKRSCLHLVQGRFRYTKKSGRLSPFQCSWLKSHHCSFLHTHIHIYIYSIYIIIDLPPHQSQGHHPKKECDLKATAKLPWGCLCM